MLLRTKLFTFSNPFYTEIQMKPESDSGITYKFHFLHFF